MGRPKKNPVECPRCRNVGSIGLKGNTVVVRHYDSKKRTGGGMTACRIGNISKTYGQMRKSLKRVDSKTELPFSNDEERVWNKLRNTVLRKQHKRESTSALSSGERLLAIKLLVAFEKCREEIRKLRGHRYDDFIRANSKGFAIYEFVNGRRYRGLIEGYIPTKTFRFYIYPVDEKEAPLGSKNGIHTQVSTLINSSTQDKKENTKVKLFTMRQ